MILAAIPSPTTAVWHIGPIPLRAYALFIVLGIVVACVVTEARLRERGAPRLAVLDLAVWAVPFGIVGARLYHVISTPELFFGQGYTFPEILIEIVSVWNGGLGIWGGIAGGAFGVWLACRQLKLPFLMVADAAAVGIPLAQAIGRLGNWFNNELYGAETSLPWGLRVHQMSDGQALPNPQTGEIEPLPGLYHPTFLYEALWCIGVAVLVWWLGRRLRLGHGRQFALYVMAYTAGRVWIEMLRIDDTAEMPGAGAQDVVMTLFGQRINVWVSVLVFLAALAYFLRVRGPQEFVVPIEDEGDGDGYRVVTEPEYRAHQQAQQATAGMAVPPPPTEPPTGASPGEPAAGSSAGSSSGDRDTTAGADAVGSAGSADPGASGPVAGGASAGTATATASGTVAAESPDSGSAESGPAPRSRPAESGTAGSAGGSSGE